jgi:short subunit dehydrogenase-like uncharacterized protein
MTARVILFGATGFTGRLAAEAMTRAGLAPVLAGRHADALVGLVGDLAGLAPIDRPPTWQQADVADPDSVRALVSEPSDVLVTTVGPFTRLGRPAIEAAIDAGCAYADSTGEGPFIRAVFEQDGPRAQANGARLMTAIGYDYVPGNLAGALAIEDARAAGRIPVAVEIGYFVTGGMGLSSGTKASAAAIATAPAFTLRSGTIVDSRGSVLTFDWGDGRTRDALPIGASEHFTLPRLDPGLRDVSVGLGWAGAFTKAANAVGSATSALTRVPIVGSGVSKAVEVGVGKASGGTGEGPSAEDRAGTRTVVLARTTDAVGRELSRVRVEGPSPYDLTADLLAWTAAMLATGQARGTGALGPVDAFGLEALVTGCADMGLRRVD